MPAFKSLILLTSALAVAGPAPAAYAAGSPFVVAQAEGEELQQQQQRRKDEGGQSRERQRNKDEGQQQQQRSRSGGDEQQQRRERRQQVNEEQQPQRQERRQRNGEDQQRQQLERRQRADEEMQRQRKERGERQRQQRNQQADEEMPQQRRDRRQQADEEQQRQRLERRQRAQDEERQRLERRRQADEEQQRQRLERRQRAQEEERQRLERRQQADDDQQRRDRDRQQRRDGNPEQLDQPGAPEQAGTRDRRQQAEEEMRRRLEERRRQQREPGQAEQASGRDSERLNDRDLRRRVRDNRDALSRRDLPAEDRARLEERYRADREELTRRLRATTGNRLPEGVIEEPARAREEARTIISDRRPARELTEDDLRNRLTRNRSLLRLEDLSEEQRRDLRQRLADDRDELRQRVARERREGDGDRDGRPRPPDRFGDWDGDTWNRDSDRGGWEQALNDRRPGRVLSEQELNRRIRATRAAMQRGYGGIPRSRLEAQLREDRRELRRRMRDWRYERDDWWDDYDNDVNISIGIMIIPNQPPMWRPPIEYAEVDDMMLQEWLVAPPTMPIERQYTVEEIEQTPTLRQAMPGIEIDSIQFGFNEDFIPEEEIGELSRIGEILEGILRTNPDEVFLIEGHTDAVGSDRYNLDLSRRRAMAVKSSLTEFFNIRPENLETVGYGEQFLKIPTPDEEPENRRVTIRRITPLVGQR